MEHVVRWLRDDFIAGRFSRLTQTVVVVGERNYDEALAELESGSDAPTGAHIDIVTLDAGRRAHLEAWMWVSSAPLLAGRARPSRVLLGTVAAEDGRARIVGVLGPRTYLLRLLHVFRGIAIVFAGLLWYSALVAAARENFPGALLLLLSSLIPVAWFVLAYLLLVIGIRMNRREEALLKEYLVRAVGAASEERLTTPEP